MNRFAHRVGLGLLACMLIGVAADEPAPTIPKDESTKHAAENNEDPGDGWNPPKAQLERIKRIEDEIKSINTSSLDSTDDVVKFWTGQYYEGDGLGHNVCILFAPKSGFSYTLRGCLGLYDHNHGDITDISTEGFTVDFVRPLERGAFSEVSDRFFFVAVGKHRYLIAESQMIPFCRDYAKGETLFSYPLLNGSRGVGAKSEDREPAKEPPPLPVRYKRFLIDRHIDATVTNVNDAKSTEDKHGTTITEIHCTINRGSEDGVFTGLYFYDEQKQGRLSYRVIDVGATSATVAMRQPSDINDRLRTPRVNDQMTTRPTW